MHLATFRLSSEAWVPDYVRNLPAIRNLMLRGGVDLRVPVTFITGDNGAGKSTLLEGVARALAFPEGGGPRFGFDGTTLPGGPFTVRADHMLGGFYLSAEFHPWLVAGADGADARGARLGMQHRVAHSSHGEAVFDLLGEYTRGPGIYLLDEPEAGLSVVRQMALLAEIHAAAQRGAQFLIATHSAILPAVPGAEILEVNDAGIMTVGYDELESVRATREFFDNPAEVADYLTGEPD